MLTIDIKQHERLQYLCTQTAAGTQTEAEACELVTFLYVQGIIGGWTMAKFYTCGPDMQERILSLCRLHLAILLTKDRVEKYMNKTLI